MNEQELAAKSLLGTVDLLHQRITMRDVRINTTLLERQVLTDALVMIQHVQASVQARADQSRL